MSTSPRPPKYCRSKEKNRPDRAYITLDGKKIWLGRYGSTESKQRYTELIAKPPEGGRLAAPPSDPTIIELLVLFLEHAQEYYDGNELGNFKSVARLLQSHAGDDLAKDFQSPISA